MTFKKTKETKCAQTTAEMSAEIENSNLIMWKHDLIGKTLDLI